MNGKKIVEGKKYIDGAIELLNNCMNIFKIQYIDNSGYIKHTSRDEYDEGYSP